MDDGSAVPSATHTFLLSQIQLSPEQELSKRERTRNQPALPGWASQDGEPGDKQQQESPRAVWGCVSASLCHPGLGTALPAHHRASPGIRQGVLGQNGSRRAEEAAGLEPMVHFSPCSLPVVAC